MNYLDLFNNITDFARKSNDIKAMILFGSRCRSENVADEWSDYDLMFFVDNPDSFIYKDEWLEEIGNVKISFVQSIVPQNLERRIIFEDGTDVDFIFYDVKDSRKILENETILLWFSRGFNILVDKCNCEKLIKENKNLVVPNTLFTESDFNNLVQKFWFECIWAVKKLNRGELWASKFCIDSYLKNLIKTLLEQEAKIIFGVDCWHDGKFFDRWAFSIEGESLQNLPQSFGGYDKGSLCKALENTMDIFSKIAKNVYEKMKYPYLEDVENFARNQIELLLRKA